MSEQNQIDRWQWRKVLAKSPCEICKAQVIIARNPETQKTGQLDPRAPIFAARRPADGSAPTVTTAAKFLETVAAITNDRGQVITPDLILPLAWHRSTCRKTHAIGNDPPRPPAWIGTPNPCTKCERPMVFLKNAETKRWAPCDVVTPLYLVKRPRDRELLEPAEELIAQPLAAFMQCTQFFTMNTGELEPAENIAFFVGHFATCTSPDFFSRGH